MIRSLNNEVLSLIKEEEGYRQFPYLCSRGKTTIGYGFNLDDVGLSKEEAGLLLEFRVDKIEEELFHKYFWFRPLDDNRKSAIISMVYQLGINGFSKFKKMIKALENEDYDLASTEMLDSKWARQTPNRVLRAAEIIRKGK